MKKIEAKNNGISIDQEEIQVYLRDLRKIEVMTPAREKELASKIMGGTCSPDEIKEIEKELIHGNLRFVITVAKQYQNQGLEMSDLIAEGNIGLIKAIKNFDWSKNLRFISYAVWWIRQSILQSLNENARTIRLPVNVVQDLYKAKKEAENGIKELDDKFASLPSTLSLNDHINEEGDGLIDLIVNHDSLRPDEFFDEKGTLRAMMINMLQILDEREKQIVEDYFGLYGTPRTLEDIGDDFSLTKERVRQIKEKALRKLRNESSILFDYL